MQESTQAPQLKEYNDVIFRIILAAMAAHLIVSFGARENLFQLLLMWDYWRSFIYSFVIAFLLINLVYIPTVKLDKRYDWKQKTIQRIGLQTLFGLIIPSLIAFLLAAVYFRIFDMWILDTHYLQFDFPVIVLMLLLLNIYYLAFYFYRHWQYAENVNSMKDKQTEHASPKDKSIFIVQKGAKNIPLPIEGICYFYHDGDYNFVRTFEREDFLITQPLDEVQKQLPQQHFFRANRQIIVNFFACQHFEPLEFGKLELVVNPRPKEQIVISQKRAKAFKEWIGR